MKKYFLTLCFACFATLSLSAQTFEAYIALFPAINSLTTWQDADIAAMPASAKTIISKDFYSFIGGGGQWGNKDAGYTGEAKLYPIGKVEIGGTVVVFIAATTYGYKADYDTQMTIDAFSYNKKTGALLRGGRSSYVFSVGGDPKTNTFMYTGKVETDGKTWLKVYQTGTGSAVTKQHAYKLSSKGLSFDKEF